MHKRVAWSQLAEKTRLQALNTSSWRFYQREEESVKRRQVYGSDLQNNRRRQSGVPKNNVTYYYYLTLIILFILKTVIVIIKKKLIPLSKFKIHIIYIISFHRKLNRFSTSQTRSLLDLRTWTYASIRKCRNFIEHFDNQVCAFDWSASNNTLK